MVFGIKFNYPHAFFLSVGVVLLVFGVTPFYLGSFDYSTVHWAKVATHIASIAIALLCIWKGLSLWSKKEGQREEFDKIKRARMKQEFEIRKQELAGMTLKNKIGKLSSELKLVEEDKKKKGAELGKEKGKLSGEIKSLSEELASKKTQIIEAKTQLYTLKESEIEKIPDSDMSSSGASIGSIAPTPFGMHPSGLGGPGFTLKTFPIDEEKSCSNCGVSNGLIRDCCYACGCEHFDR